VLYIHLNKIENLSYLVLTIPLQVHSFARAPLGLNSLSLGGLRELKKNGSPLSDSVNTVCDIAMALEDNA
jgi:hypothetical protein